MTVGPVLARGPRADAVVAAIREQNPGVVVEDRGGYVRVSCPGPCVLSRATVEAHFGAAFDLRRDLGRVMTSFSGRLVLDEEVAEWR